MSVYLCATSTLGDGDGYVQDCLGFNATGNNVYVNTDSASQILFQPGRPLRTVYFESETEKTVNPTRFYTTDISEPLAVPTAAPTCNPAIIHTPSMAPVEVHKATSLVPAAVLSTHFLLSGYFSIIIGRTLYRSYLTLPPSSATRFREPLRRGHVRTFSILAAVSFTTALYFFVAFSSLSYRAWASERGVELPQSLFGENGALRGGEHPGRLHIFKWLSDTSFYREVLETVAEKARHYWWGQQITLGMVSWSTFVAIEGQRRKIPYLWCFMALAQLVNLSYAQNLFFLAVLLTPVPLPENVRDLTRDSVLATSSRYPQLVQRILPGKPEGWFPKSPLYITLLLSTYATVFLVPFASNTPSFMTVSLISRGLLFVPLALPYISPQSWGTIHNHPHEAYSNYITLFKTISFVSFILQFKSYALAIAFNTPESTRYRHTQILNIPYKKEHRSPFDRGSVAFGKLFGAIWEHSAVGAVGWDVILSGLSLGVWAAARNLDAQNMFRATLPVSSPADWESEEKIPSLKANDVVSLKTTGRKRPSRAKKPSTKRRTRQEKAEEDNDSTYAPSDSDQLDEGDEESEGNWEIGALAWGIITAAGLGIGSAAVLGAEVVAR